MRCKFNYALGLIITLCVTTPCFTWANSNMITMEIVDDLFIQVDQANTVQLILDSNIINTDSIDNAINQAPHSITPHRKQKAVAVILAITLGYFGAHRLYLTTSNKVPIIYTLTLGGGFGVLVIADIIAILTTKDIYDYSPNDKIFMWTN